MSVAASAALPLTVRQRGLLEGFVRSHGAPQHMVKRARIILRGGDGQSTYSIEKQLVASPKTIRTWRGRWQHAHESLCLFEQGEGGEPASDRALLAKILEALGDRARSGAPPRFTVAQREQIMALACQKPTDHDLPLSRWTHEQLARQATSMGIVDSISPSWVGVILKNTPAPTAQEPLLALPQDQ